MKNLLKLFRNDESGASAAEYALILVVIGLGLVAAATTLEEAISGALTETAGVISDSGSGGTTDPGTTDPGTV